MPTYIPNCITVLTIIAHIIITQHTVSNLDAKVGIFGLINIMMSEIDYQVKLY